MKNSQNTLLALTLITLASTSQASYTVLIPAESDKGGALPNNSIQFVTPEEAPVENNEPAEIVWDVETVLKTKFAVQISIEYTDTKNTTIFTNHNGGFRHTVTTDGFSRVSYQFIGTYGEPLGLEFGNFITPSKVMVQSGEVTLNCSISNSVLYSPYRITDGRTYYTNYSAQWTCDGVLPNLVRNKPSSMKLKFE